MHCPLGASCKSPLTCPGYGCAREIDVQIARFLLVALILGVVLAAVFGLGWRP